MFYLAMIFSNDGMLIIHFHRPHIFERFIK